MNTKTPGAPNRRRMSRQARREQIVDAALRAFSRHGFRGATTRRLAHAAGVTEVTLFRYFPRKEDLFRAVLDTYSILPVLRAEMVEPPRRGGAQAALRNLGRRFLGLLRERQDLIRLVLSEAVVNPRMARMMFRQGPGRFFEDAAKVLQAYHTRGEIRRVDFELASRAFLGVFFTFILTQEILLGKEVKPMDLDRAADELSDILWRGLCCASRGRKGG